MKNRSPIAVFLLGLITLGFYLWYWFVKTKGEMNRTADTNILTAWIWLIPVVGWIWWLWKYSIGVEKITNGKWSSALAFVVLFLLPYGIGSAIAQHAFNESQKVNPPQSPSPETNI